ncbi:small glutamine-rich tetratricopeptide repeat-containing protein 2 [Podospora conica]|nr:small glutamine-rich tetratricopeptide repeat-containing protein 2 [Schizothecium conicum]
MTEVAGLVLGVAALWKTCVQIYEVVDSSRQYGMDSEILSVKFEVERVRLICWGDAVGLQNLVSPGDRDTSPPAPGAPPSDPRLARPEVRTAVLRVLGCIHHSFENTTRLQEHYGLQPTTPTTPDADLPPPTTQTDRILGAVFRRAYASLRRVAADRQAPLKRRAAWAVRDRARFLALVAELRGFNDSLESLFPDAPARVAEAMRADIDDTAAEGARELTLLREATAGENRGVSEGASLRLEALGVTASARTELLSGVGSVSGGVEGAVGEEADEEIRRVTDGEREVSELERRMGALELFVSKKNRGALSTFVFGPYSRMRHVSAHIRWEGDKVDKDWNFETPWSEKDKGFVAMSHIAFEMFKKKKYISRRGRTDYDAEDAEDHLLFDPESYARYENVNPGTVTVEGFGIERWDYEESKPGEMSILVNHADLPVLKARRLLRRLHEIQSKVGKFGWSPAVEELNLKEFIGEAGLYGNKDYAHDRSRRIEDLYSLLNRTDIFFHFTKESSVGAQWITSGGGNSSIGLWNLIRQIVLGWELMIRLETLEAKAEAFKTQGNDALKRGEFQRALDLYTEAIKIDLTNAIYRSNRSAALVELQRYEDAEEDAYIATQLDPKYAKAWSRLGLAALRQGAAQRAKKAFERAIQMAGKDSTAQMRKGLADADNMITEQLQAINTEKNKAKEHALRSEFLDHDWEIIGKTPELYSLVHEQQVEGLLHFAERMKWPYINEARDYAEDAYATIRGGGTIPVHLHDWLFGIILPGKWFAFKIMTALIMCTQSLAKQIRFAHYYDCGLSLPTRSYWRQRTVLGRVLGPLPGVIALCGWIGPCPRVTIASSPDDDKPRHIRLKTRREIDPYLADIRSSTKWLIPAPPVRDISTWTIASIDLTPLPRRTNLGLGADADADALINEANETEYRASITFQRDDGTEPVTYKLYTNPVFVTVPPCRAPAGGGEHEVHMRELGAFRRVWEVERLKEHVEGEEEEGEEGSEEGGKGGVMVINATGKGAEVVARAWCSERGRNAVVRRKGGPCFRDGRLSNYIV